MRIMLYTARYHPLLRIILEPSCEPVWLGCTLAPGFAHSSVGASCLAADCSMDRPPRRGLPRPNDHSHVLTS